MGGILTSRANRRFLVIILVCFSVASLSAQYELKTDLTDYTSQLKSLNLTLVKPLNIDWYLEGGLRFNFILNSEIDPNDLVEDQLAYNLNSFLNGGFDIGIVRNTEFVDLAFLTGYQYNSLNMEGYSCSGITMVNSLAVCNDYGIYEINQNQHTINLRLRASHKFDITIGRKNKLYIEPAFTIFARSFNLISGDPETFLDFEGVTSYENLGVLDYAYSEGVLSYGKTQSTFVQLNIFLGYRF